MRKILIRRSVFQVIVAGCIVGAATASWVSADARMLGVQSAQAALTAELAQASTQLTIPSDVEPPVSQWSGTLQNFFSYITTPKGRVCFATQIQITLTPSACVWGDAKAKREVALIGDSQAFQWLPALDAWGQKAHWKVLVLAKASCRPWPSSEYLWADHVTAYPQCPAFNAFVVKTLNRLKPQATIVAAEIGVLSESTVETEAQIVTGMRQLKRSLAPAHTRLLMLQNTPWFWGLPSSPACLAANQADVAVCAQPRAKSQSGPNVIEEPMRDAIVAIGVKKIAKIVPVDDLVCGPSMCPMISGAILIYIDDAHISNTWMMHIEPALAQMLVKPLNGL